MAIADAYLVLLDRATKDQPEHRRMLPRLKKLKSNLLDDTVHRLHKEAFEIIDCLQCGNCCRGISPRMTDRDIERIGKSLKLTPTIVSEKYIMRDDDEFYCFKQSPCPFIGEDNYCQVYKDSPRACKEYPHTDRPKFTQIIDLSFKNSIICPAVAYVFIELRKIF
jgi:Fe-S-cluster containining protein